MYRSHTYGDRPGTQVTIAPLPRPPRAGNLFDLAHDVGFVVHAPERRRAMKRGHPPREGLAGRSHAPAHVAPERVAVLTIPLGAGWKDAAHPR